MQISPSWWDKLSELECVGRKRDIWGMRSKHNVTREFVTSHRNTLLVLMSYIPLQIPSPPTNPNKSNSLQQNIILSFPYLHRIFMVFSWVLFFLGTATEDPSS